MMKKTMLHAMCLSASLLMMTGTTVSYAATANASVMAAAEEGGDEGTPSGAQATWEDETNKLLKVTVTAAGQFATWANSATDAYKAATRINVVGENVTLSEEDLAATKNITSLKTIDLSQVKVASKAAYSKIVGPTVNYVVVKLNLIIPAAENTKDEKGNVTAYGNQILNVRQAYDPNLTEASTSSTWNNDFWNNIKGVFSFYKNESGAEDCYVLWLDNTPDVASIASKKCNNLSIVTNVDANLGNVSVDDFWGEINKVQAEAGQPAKLVLSNMSDNVKTSYYDISKLTNPIFKWVVLPNQLGDGYQTKDLTTIKGGEGSDVEVLQILEGTTVDVATLKAYIFAKGALKALENNHYYQTDFSNAFIEKYSGAIQVDEDLTAEDAVNEFTFFNGVKNNRLDLSDLQHEGTDKDGNEYTLNMKSAISTFKNPYVEYLVLPDGVRTAEDPTFANLFTDANPQLKGVGLYTVVTTTIGEGEAAKDSTVRSIVISSHERGAAYQVQGVFGATKLNKDGYVDRIQISGLVSAIDLNKNNENYVDVNGHLSLSYTKHETNGSGVAVKKSTDATTIPQSYMSSCGAKTLDLTNVRLYDASESLSDDVKAAAQNDLNIAALGWSGLTSIALPTDASAYRLTNGALYNIQGITSLCIPTNFTELGEHSLQNYSHIANIYTSDVKDGNRVWYINGREIDHEPTAAEIAEKSTCTLPLNLTRIEFQALASLSLFTDVYVVNNKSGNVPYCERDAFDAASYYGHSGFNGTHPITRANYKNGTGKTFAILHFPNGLKREQTKLYTDITRNYTLTDETGATDDNGDLFVWPTQAQWIAAYSQASTGYNWEDWKMDEGATGGYTNGETYGDYLTETRETIFSTGAKASENLKLVGLTENDLKKQDSFAPTDTDGWPLLQGDTYIGWHQFVLTGAYNMADDSNIWHSYITDDNWWTISLPFDMSKAQIEETFGEGTLLCTLTGVTRDASKNNITFNFGKDLVANAESEDATVLVNRAPYMIKPGKKEKLKNDTDGENEYSGPIFKLTTEQNKTVSKLDLNNYKDKTIADLLNDETNKCAVVVDAKNENGKAVDTTDKEIADDATDAQNYKYIFVAQYTKYYIPTYGYFLGWDNDANKANYFYQKEKANVQNWNAYTCTIGHYTPSQAKWVIPAGTSTSAESGRWEFSCVDGDARSLTADNLPTSGDSEAKISMFFGADNTTSIEGISANGGIQTIPAGMVYNLNGQVVSTNGTAGLAKGIYIANGKKFIVK